MLIVISPAKKLSEKLMTSVDLTNPLYEDKAHELAKVMAIKSTKELQDLMSISEKLATLNQARFKAMKFPQDKNTYPAAYLFSGDTYQGLEFESFNKNQVQYAQNHLRILSGLYGILKPLDAIQPYRLEMGTKLKTKDGENLYQVWRDLNTKAINQELKKHKALINLASNEYFSSIDADKISKPIIEPVFKEERNGKFKIISFNAKRARGLMSQYILKNKLKSPEELKSFDLDDYKFNQKLSNDSQFVFTR